MADEQSKRRSPVGLTKESLSTIAGTALLELLGQIVADGSLTDDEIRELAAWLEHAAPTSTIPGIHFLREEITGIMVDRAVTDAERKLLRNAILRVLPLTERERAKARIADATVREREAAKARRTEELAAEDLATSRQLAYIRDLGGACPDNATKREGSAIIERLLAGPTVRQRMVLRFWNQFDLMSAGASDVSAWMDNWYAEDPHRLDAWTLWKRESGDNGGRSPGSIDRVPLGAGQEYLARVTAGASAARPETTMNQMYCSNCGTVDTPRTRVKGSFFIEVILWLCFLVPGIIYSIWRLTSKEQVCPSCGAPNMIPSDSPKARGVLQDPSAPYARASTALPPRESTRTEIAIGSALAALVNPRATFRGRRTAHKILVVAVYLFVSFYLLRSVWLRA